MIIKLYHHIGGDKAIKHLSARISFPDMDIRLQALLALSKLNYNAAHHEQLLIRQTIESNIEGMVWLMASIQDIEADVRTKHLQNALQEELAQKREHVFLLLSLIYDGQTIRLIRRHIESGNSQSKIFALEISDMTVSDEIKEILLPLFDDISIQERLSLFKFRFPQEKLSCLHRIFDIINKDYNVIRNWTKACAVELLIHFDKAEVAECLCANIVNPSRMISETAAWVLHTMDQGMFYDVLSVQRPDHKLQLEAVTKKLGRERSFQEKLMITEKTESLKNSGLFTGIPDYILAELAVTAVDLPLIMDQTVASTGDQVQSLCLVLSGQIDLIRNKLPSVTFNTGDVFIKYPEGISKKDVIHVAKKESLLLIINMDEITDLLRDYPDFTRKFLAWYQ